MSTLQRSGWEQVKRGITSLPEIMRYAEQVVESAELASPIVEVEIKPKESEGAK